MPPLEKARFRHIVLQPTAACNLNCTYCYLPDRKRRDWMAPDVALAVAKSVEEIQGPVTLVWHGGEPLATGITRYRKLLEPFTGQRKNGKLRHSIQTNATLLSDEWCGLLREEGFAVGVSLDGTNQQNSARLTWGGENSFEMVVRGIDALRRAGIPFSIIAVVNSYNIDDPQGFYEFLRSLGCETLNVNIEEREGLNIQSRSLHDEEVRRFWKGLFIAWRSAPSVSIREFRSALGWLSAQSRSDDQGYSPYAREFWPTVATNGDVVVLSPELISTPTTERWKFVVGNVLRVPLGKIVEQSTNEWYVRDFFSGVRRCAAECAYYAYCGGVEASNKHFELDDIADTETAHCRHTKQFVIDAILDVLE
jgi:uncharacterized protein